MKKKVGLFIDLRRQKLTLEVQEGLPDLYTDQNKIVNFILFNLVMNAIKYSEDEKDIIISAEHSSDEKVLITVRDTGIGIGEEELKNVFSPFYVAGEEKYHHSGVYEFKSSGIGLGLSIAKNSLDLMGEKIYCKSEKGKWTEFSFTVPVYKNNI